MVFENDSDKIFKNYSPYFQNIFYKSKLSMVNYKISINMTKPTLFHSQKFLI